MSYITEPIVGVRLDAVGRGDGTTNAATTPVMALGSRLKANDGVYQYVKASATIALYDVVKISNTFTAQSATATLLATTEPCKVGIANQVALTVGQYGWVFVGPGSTVTANFNGAAAVDVKLYGTVTAGAIDDASSGAVIVGLKVATTVAGAGTGSCTAECELFCNG